jgi:hypothetical protein
MLRAMVSHAMPPDAAVLHDTDRLPQPPGGPLRDYILTDYAPVCDPAGRLHSVSVLRHFLRVHGLTGLWPIITRCQELLGPDETVWGTKYLPDGSASIELYFYVIREREDAAAKKRKTVSHLVAGLADVVQIDSRLDERLDYFMCSLELDRSVVDTGKSAGFRIYVSGNRRVEGYDGISYWVKGDELLQENYYLFYRADTELEAARARFAGSVRAGGAESRGRLFPAWLASCFTVCFATKRFTDALYFSRVDTPQLLRFLDQYMPGPVTDMLRGEQDAFAHLRWDVGYDFTTSATDSTTAKVLKAGFYGFA